MRNKKNLSPQTKRILTGIGIAFGTVMIFFVSFFLSFNFIVNPITFTNIGDSDTEKENKELKEEVQSLQDEIDVLNTTVEKYRNNKSSAPQISTTEIQTNTTTSGNTQAQSSTTSNGSSGAESQTNSGTTSDTTESKTEPETSESSKFTPETTVTPESGIVHEVEEPITVIDISE